MLRAAAITACVLAFSLALAAQEPAEPPKEPDPAIAEKVARLDDAWGDRRMSRDAEAAELIDQLREAAAVPLHPSDRQRILGALVEVLTRGKLRPVEASEPYRKAAEGLALFGSDGAKVLLKIYDKKRFPRHPEWSEMRATLVSCIGKTEDPRAVEFLCETAQRSGENDVLKAAGKACGHFADADEKARKEMVEILARRLAGFEGTATRPPVNQQQQLNLDREAAVQTLREVRPTWLDTLAKLTGEEFADGYAADRWYAKNKSKRWPVKGQ